MDADPHAADIDAELHAADADPHIYADAGANLLFLWQLAFCSCLMPESKRCKICTYKRVGGGTDIDTT